MASKMIGQSIEITVAGGATEDRVVSNFLCYWCGGNGAYRGDKLAGQCPACLGYGQALALRIEHGQYVFE